MCYHVYVIMHVKDPWLYINSFALCSSSRFLPLPIYIMYIACMCWTRKIIWLNQIKSTEQWQVPFLLLWCRIRSNNIHEYLCWMFYGWTYATWHWSVVSKVKFRILMSCSLFSVSQILQQKLKTTILWQTKTEIVKVVDTYLVMK